jgi:hypothetical protein
VDENKSKVLYEDDSPHESHHYTVSSIELVGPLCDIPHHVDEITFRDLDKIDCWSQRRKLYERSRG